MGVLLLALPLGLLVGGLLGLVGAGGSIIAVPALVYALGLSPAEAIPSSLIVVGLAALVGVLPRIRQGVDWSTATIVALAGIPAAWLGAAVNRMLDPNLLMLVFAALMVIAGIRMIPKRGQAAVVSPERRNLRTHVPRALLVGALVGFLTGLLGIGGGFIIVPALTLVLGLGIGVAVGTSLVIIVINSAAGLAAYASTLALDWPLVLTFAGAAIAGSLVAARFATRLSERKVKATFAGVVLVVAAGVSVASVYALVTG
ncbi:sulfite exporter TauE/SafE family protein [Cryobacterium sp. TMT2-10]|uniref:Probable membrane transporter protein n=1 Tax=Cryobacterium shii TaxID=1259235 RepID=A0AAQ2C6L2_9MICO|nr:MULTISPECIES: sulfite exporter TauE/SafE family protein [Cryobacterium]TFC47103.1 sulfite exporter TauE/SafE family protein [Cryobacterium shii]TFC85410.1 sulfite exporter TauE/SafE family protein [Cryobacterium sp. TmT2-59]TFD13088.1 sulfite exporter TauE/SafE family protein [Cryobacterium sp. TMT4-10]TFD37957.1 sulfite exporter TauE/SafE family protein [Cryobacterium sp. TMT2-10]